MQTFLPYSDFEATARCLDYRRLGNQRKEVLQMLNALSIGPRCMRVVKGRYGKYKTPWYNHTATQMWRGYEQALILYGLTIVQEWVRRGYKDTCAVKIANMAKHWYAEVVYPPWLGNFDFHASHRSNLLRKDYDYYSQFGWLEPNNLNYVWPEGDSNEHY